MRVDIPDCVRCCVCVPLRHGILIFGYLNLGFTVFFLVLEMYLCLLYDNDIIQFTRLYMYRGVGLYSQIWLMLIIYILDIIFNVVLLVGAHMKRPKLIRVYYYYGITTSLAAFACYVLIRNHPEDWTLTDHLVFEFCFAFSGLVLQGYLLLLIRSELKKMSKNETQMCYVNHACEVHIKPSYDEQGISPL